MTSSQRSARGYRPRFASPEQDSLLDQILAVATQHAETGVAVFDLDATLFDNRPRIIQIWRELASRADLPALYAVSPEHFVDWDHARTLRAAGIPAEQVADMMDRVEAAFFRDFFNGDCCVYDHAMPGAARMVWACYRAGLRVVYLTGRHEPMRAGTEASLLRWGFPLFRPGVELVLKPFEEHRDEAFKAEALREIRHLGTPVLFVDNEPTNVNVFHNLAPRAFTVWMETDHSPRPVSPREGIPALRSWMRTTDPGAEVGVGRGPAGSSG